MTESDQHDKSQALHELMENEFQQLVDIIEQKQIVHENIEFSKEPPDPEPIMQSARQLHRQSRELGADTLAEFFYELESNARHGVLDETDELLTSIHDEFEKVKDILSSGD